MNFWPLKLIAIAAILLVLCLPFFPQKFAFSLAAPGYKKKGRWRNICFVLETALLGLILLCLSPLIKNGLHWFFELKFVQWLLDFIPDRIVYTVDVAAILLVNLLVCAVFWWVKKIFRAILDGTVFKDAPADPTEKKKRRTKVKKAKNDDARRSEKRLKQLRRQSVLVFGRTKKEQKTKAVPVSDYKIQKKNADAAAQNGKKPQKDTGDEALSFFELLKSLWYKFIGLFYSEADGYAYVRTPAYRFAKELKSFVALVSLVHFLAYLAMLLPAFFSFDSLPGFYEASLWLADNMFLSPILSLVWLYELLWFVDGEAAEPEEAEAPFVTFVSGIREEKKADLARVRNALLDKYGKSYSIKNFDAAVMGGKSTYTLSDKKQSIQNMTRAIRQSRGFVNGDYMQSIEYMFEGKHVLFDSSLYSSLGEYMVHYLFVTLSFGTRILFICKDKKEIEAASAYLEAGFKQITGTSQILWRISTFEKMHEGEKPDILLLTPEQFLERSLFIDGRDFFDELTDVFVLDADQILTANNYYCLIMAKKLEKFTSSGDGWTVDADLSAEVGKRLRYSFFSSGYIQSLGNSIRQFFNLEDAPLETFHSFALAARTEVFVWHMGTASTLYVDNGANQVALEVQIAKDACNLGVTNINLISETAVYSSQLSEIRGLTLNRCDLTDVPTGYVIVADDGFNLPNTIYNYARFSGRRSSVLHVVSKPYLLRDYFTAKAENYVSHFELIGETMCEHAEAKKASIIILLCDAVNGIERSAFIRRATELLGDKLQGGDGTPDLTECVRLCFEAAFGTDTVYEPQYNLKTEQNSELQNKTFVYLRNSSHLFERLLECTNTVKLEYVNTQSVESLPVFRGEITQHFIPGQILVRNNRAYTIKDMDVKAGTLVLDDTGPSVNVPVDYIQTRLYSIANEEVISTFGHDYRAKNSVVSHVGFTVYDADITVDTVGYYSIEIAVQTVDLVKPNFAKYVNLADSDALLQKLRREIRSRVLVIELDIAEESDPHVTYTLSVLLHEFMKTVFPHQYRCISVCPLFDTDCEEEFFAEETAIRDLYPRITGTFGAPRESTAAGKIRIAVIEDVSGGNGVVETLVDGSGIAITNLLHVAADFLAWVQSSAGEGFNYLHFGYDQLPALFDLAKLEEILRQFRLDVERSELVRLFGDHNCSFCHRPLDAEQGEDLGDGRVICTHCKESSVSTFEELNAVLTSVLDEIKKNTAAADTFPADITVDFVSTTELRERYGEDAEKLPIAYCNHVTHCIYLEYGLPKAAACGALARMITELWQDENVTSDGSAIYYGHPDYVELQVLAALRFNTEADLLARYYEGREGLSELKRALHEQGETDSFTFFLGGTGKKKDGGGDRDKDNDGKDKDKDGRDDDGDDTPFVVERDPAALPRYLYNRLPDEEKAIYDQMYNAIQRHAEGTGAPVSEIGGQRCYDILGMVIDDNPDIFWCAHSPGTVTVDSSGKVRNVIFKYVMTEAEVKRRKKQIEKSVKSFLKGITPSMSDYEAALRAHENIVELIDYDSIGLSQQEKDPDRREKPDNLRSIYGVFVEEKAVCAGYARAFQYLLNRLGIECAYLKGPCHDGEWHAWNLTKLEGEYYFVDVTFDDHSNTDMRKNRNAETSYDYFAITSAELSRSRKIHNPELYPDCTAVKCNYFIREKLFFTEYNAAHLTQIITAALKAGKKEIAFKMESAAVLALVKDRLITKQGIFDILRSIDTKKHYTSVSHYTNEELHILHIIVGE